TLLLAALQHGGPDFALIHIPIDHFLHPVIGYTYPEKQVLDRITDVFDIQKLADIRMIDIQVGGKSAPPDPALGNGIHHRVEELHETDRPAAFPVVGHRTPPLAQSPEVPR